MLEPPRLQIWACEHYLADIQACLKEMACPGVTVKGFPARCGHPPLTREELIPDPGTQALVLGSCCLSQLPDHQGSRRVCRLQTCQEMLVDPHLLEPFQREGTYVLSSAWLQAWHRHLDDWGGDPEVVRELMRETASSLLCLDTGTGPEDLFGEMAALGKAVGLLWEVLPVGRARLRVFLEGLIEISLTATTVPDSELSEARRQAADRALALEFLGELSQTLRESEVQSRIEAFFRMLFGATTVAIRDPQEPLLESHEEYRTTGDGFLARLGGRDQGVGVLEVSGLAFPQYCAYYLNLTLSVAGVCALAVQNARTYRALRDAQASQRLMLNVLDAFYRPGEHLEELEAALEYLQAYTQVDALAVRLARNGGLETWSRGFSPEHCSRECDLRVRDLTGALRLDPNRHPVLAGLCGHLLNGTLPHHLRQRTARGTFWTNDLQALEPTLDWAELEGGARGLCAQEGYRSMALIPLWSGSEILGLLQINHRQPGRFTSELLDLLEGVAGSMALGLERRFAEERLRCVNQELENRVQKRTAELAAINENLRSEIEQRTRVEEEKGKVEQQLLQAQKLEAIGTLAGGIAHDFNNILTPILGFAEMGLLQTHEQAALHHDFEMILKAGGRARELVNQILLFSRRQEQRVGSMLFAPVLKEVLKLVRASLPTTIEIRPRLDVKDAWILADPTHIHQIVLNLCTNAGHAMELSGGILEVILERNTLAAGDPLTTLQLRPGAYVVLQISDTGCGIPKDVLSRIFEPFFTTKAIGKGTGLGLSVVHGLVKTYHGHISVYSEPGQGTVFRIYLPEAVDIQAHTVAAAAEAPIRGGTERVLVVDDDESALQTLVALLEGLGYRITAESTSPGALKRVRATPEAFDLVVTDLTLPHMTGLELAKGIQAVRKDLPLILCSGYSQGLVREGTDHPGVRAFVQKPYTVSQMARTIREVLEAG